MADEIKTDNHMRLVGDVLHGLYNKGLALWEEQKNELGDLDESFKLTNINNEPTNSLPLCQIEYLSNFGFIRVNVLTINRKDKSIIINNALYTQGRDKEIKGKGEEGLKQLTSIIQSISDASNYKVFVVVTPTIVAGRLSTREKGYESFDDDKKDKLWKLVEPADEIRWKRFLELEVEQNLNPKVKTFTPNKKNKEISHGLEVVLETMNLPSSI